MMAKTVTESIYSSETVVIPLADVQHIEKQPMIVEQYRGLVVVTKHTHWSTAMEGGGWANSIHIPHDEREDFLQAWCTYRRELEIDTLADSQLSKTCDDNCRTCPFRRFKDHETMDTPLEPDP